jgi:hypothetical protein
MLVFLAGCAATTERLESIVDDPGTVLKDPDFSNYQQKLDDLEKQYLDKKITYAEYLERKKKIEEDYAQKTQEQKNAIENPQYFKEKNETLR